jgi:multidrug resistance efflux pump
MENENGNAPQATPPEGRTRSFMTTATGEQVELPPEVVQALRGSNGSGTTDIVQADGTRLALQIPTRSRTLPPGTDLSGIRPGIHLNPPGTLPRGAEGVTQADGPVMFRRTSAEQYEATKAENPDLEAGPLAGGEMDDAIAAAAVEALAPEAKLAGKTRARVMPVGGGSADVVFAPAPAVSAADSSDQPEPDIRDSTAESTVDPASVAVTPGAVVDAPLPADPPSPSAADVVAPAEAAAPVTEPLQPLAFAAPSSEPVAGAPSAVMPAPAAPEASAEPSPAVAPEEEPAPGHGMGVEDPAAQTSMERADAANIELRSEEIDEILTSMPGGLLRWGSTVVFVTIALLLSIAWYIRYPDVVQGTISLTTPTPPVRVVSRTAGEVARVFVADRAPVHANDPLVLLKSPAAYGDVQALTAAVDRLEPALQRLGPLPDLAFDHPLALGDLQGPFSTLQQAYSDYRTLLADPFYGQKLAALQAQIGNLEQLGGRLKEQQALLDEQLGLADRNRARSRQLGTQNLSSSAEVDQAEQQYLQQRYATENGRTAITNNEIQLGSQRASLIDLQQRHADDQQRLLVQLRNAQRSLRAAISAWEQTYVLRSSVAGTVSLFRDVHENQFVNAQEPLVAVLPAAGAVVGRVTLSGVGAGKVRVGQRVIVQLESYPYKEYGTVEGRVTRISQLGFEPQAQGQAPGVGYQAEVQLPHGLVTSYGRRLVFTQEMRGVVQVVTDDVSLLTRVFNQIRSLREVN